MSRNQKGNIAITVLEKMTDNRSLDILAWPTGLGFLIRMIDHTETGRHENFILSISGLSITQSLVGLGCFLHRMHQKFQSLLRCRLWRKDQVPFEKCWRFISSEVYEVTCCIGDSSPSYFGVRELCLFEFVLDVSPDICDIMLAGNWEFNFTAKRIS